MEIKTGFANFLNYQERLCTHVYEIALSAILKFTYVIKAFRRLISLVYVLQFSAERLCVFIILFPSFCLNVIFLLKFSLFITTKQKKNNLLYTNTSIPPLNFYAIRVDRLKM